MTVTNFKNGISTFGNILYSSNGMQDISGKAFYVDANVTGSGKGTSWDEAYKTVAEGLAAADTDIGNSNLRAWAKRNTVYYCGDAISETLTLASEKTDLIGVGSDVGAFPKLTGNFTIGTAVVSFRIINMGFIPTTTAPVITFPAGMHGWGLEHVHLYKAYGVTNSAMLLSTDCRDFVMRDSFIYGDAQAGKSTIGFNIAGTTSGVGRAKIERCYICGTEALNVEDTSSYFEGAICRDTIFNATALCVDDDSDSIMFINNYLITEASGGSSDGGGVVDWNTELICGNQVHAANADGEIPAIAALA